MKVKKFKENNYKKYDFEKEILKQLDYKGFNFSFAANGIIAFTKSGESLIFIENNKHLKYQFSLKEKFVSENGGYKIYYLKKELENPFFNDGKKLEAIFYFDDDYKTAFKKCKYLVNKTFSLASEMGHYPTIKYNGEKEVTIQLQTHDTNSVTIKDEILADKITNIWRSIK